jgi:hypothetical protein
VQVKRAYQLLNPILSGNVIYRSSLDLFSPTFLLDGGGVPFKCIEESGFTPPVPTVINGHSRNADTLAWNTASYSVLPQTVYRNHHGTWQEFQPTRLQMVDRNGSVTAVDDTANTITITGTFATNDRVVLRTTGSLPGGIVSSDGGTTSRRYFVIGYTAGVCQLAETLGGSAIDITSAGSNNTIHRAYDIWTYSVNETGTSYSLGIRAWLAFAANSSATASLSSSQEVEVLIAKNTANAPVVSKRDTVALADVKEVYTTFATYPTFSITLVGTKYEITLSVAQDNSNNHGLGLMSSVKLFSHAGNVLNSQPISELGYPGRQGGVFRWDLL